MRGPAGAPRCGLLTLSLALVSFFPRPSCIPRPAPPGSCYPANLCQPLAPNRLCPSLDTRL